MFPNVFIEETSVNDETENAVLVECTAIHSVQQFIQNVLRTKINSYKVYIEGETEIFGISIYDYLGQRTLPLGYLNSELKREVTEQLLKHPLIESVTDWKGTRKKTGFAYILYSHIY